MKPPLSNASPSTDLLPEPDSSQHLQSLGTALHTLAEHTDPQELLNAIAGESARLAGAQVGFILEAFAACRVTVAAYPSMAAAETYLEHPAIHHLSDVVLFSEQAFVMSTCTLPKAPNGLPRVVTVASLSFAWDRHRDTTLNLIFSGALPDEPLLAHLRILIAQGRVMLERANQLDRARHYLEWSARLAERAGRHTPDPEMDSALVDLLDATVLAADAQGALLHLARGGDQYVFARGRAADGQDLGAERVPVLGLLDVKQLETGALIQLSAPPARLGQFKTILVLPLQSGGQRVGILSLCYTQPHPVSQIEQQALAIIANHMLTLIERARFVRSTPPRQFDLHSVPSALYRVVNASDDQTISGPANG